MLGTVLQLQNFETVNSETKSDKTVDWNTRKALLLEYCLYLIAGDVEVDMLFSSG